jgi:hypothetical protein
MPSLFIETHNWQAPSNSVLLKLGAAAPQEAVKLSQGTARYLRIWKNTIFVIRSGKPWHFLIKFGEPRDQKVWEALH